MGETVFADIARVDAAKTRGLDADAAYGVYVDEGGQGPLQGRQLDADAAYGVYGRDKVYKAPAGLQARQLDADAAYGVYERDAVSRMWVVVR